MDNLFIINQLIERTNEYDVEIKLMYIDFQKAFGSISYKYM